MNALYRRGCETLDVAKDVAPILLRVGIGAIFIGTGWQKVQAGLFSFQPDVPLGNVLGPLVPTIEFAGGILLIAGLGTRVWASLLACVMLFAIAFVHWPQGYPMRAEIVTQGGRAMAMPQGWAFQGLILAGCLTLALTGGGLLAIDRALARLLHRRREEPPPEVPLPPQV